MTTSKLTDVIGNSIENCRKFPNPAERYEKILLRLSFTHCSRNISLTFMSRLGRKKTFHKSLKMYFHDSLRKFLHKKITVLHLYIKKGHFSTNFRNILVSEVCDFFFDYFF